MLGMRCTDSLKFFVEAVSGGESKLLSAATMVAPRRRHKQNGVEGLRELEFVVDVRSQEQN